MQQAQTVEGCLAQPHAGWFRLVVFCECRQRCTAASSATDQAVKHCNWMGEILLRAFSAAVKASNSGLLLAIYATRQHEFFQRPASIRGGSQAIFAILAVLPSSVWGQVVGEVISHGTLTRYKVGVIPGHGD